MRKKAKTIVVLSGGPYHPVSRQFEQVQADLGTVCRIECFDGSEAFDHLEGCDLLVTGGLHWTGSAPDKHKWPEGVRPCGYIRPSETQREAYRNYVASGRPILGWHGGIASYDDWPEFGRLLGVRWDWKVTAHTEYADWQVEVLPTGHPVIEGVESYALMDELYYNFQIMPDLEYVIHARADFHGIYFPMILTGEGGRIGGAGKMAYLANGHSMESFASPAFRRVARNTIGWLLK